VRGPGGGYSRRVDEHTLPLWGSAALVTVDAQWDFLSERPHGVPGTTEVMPQLCRLAEAFRAARLPIYHLVRLYQGDDVDRVRRTLIDKGADVVRPGSRGRLLAPYLVPGEPELDDFTLLSGDPQWLGPDEFALYKPRWGGFYRTRLDQLLRSYDTTTVVIAGCNLPNCPRATIMEASERDFRVVLATDAVSQGSEEAFRQLEAIGVTLMETGGIIAATAETP
jgi:nicotinamidase-related amidase